MTYSDPVHIIDFRDELNCKRIEDAEPGKELEIKVRLVRPSHSPSLSAKGLRSVDGQLFDVTVSTPNGTEAHSWTWEILMDALRIHRGTLG